MSIEDARELVESLVITPECQMIKTIDLKGTLIMALDELEQYRAIGTVEDIQMVFQLCKDLQVMCGQYNDIGTVEELRELKEKATAKKPRFYAHNYYCTECGNLVGNNEFKWQRFEYCDKCGQKLDWSEFVEEKGE